MANVKISALPVTTTTTVNDYLVKNNSGETTTNKVLISNVLGLTKGSGADSIKSASFLSTTPATSTGQSSVAIGDDSEANADYATAYGYRAEVFDSIRVYGTALGAFTRVAQYSTAVGYNSLGVGAYSAAFGGGQASGGNDVAVGREASSQGSGSVAIGYQASATANDSTAIGRGSVADMLNSVAIGYNVNTRYSGSTHTAGLDTNGNVTDNWFLTPDVSNTFNANFNITSTQKIVLDANSTLSLTNLRDGGKYRLLFENTGSYNLTSVTATLESGGTPNVYYNGGNRNNLTHNSQDIWYLDVISDKVYITQFSNYA